MTSDDDTVTLEETAGKARVVAHELHELPVVLGASAGPSTSAAARCESTLDARWVCSS